MGIFLAIVCLSLRCWVDWLEREIRWPACIKMVDDTREYIQEHDIIISWHIQWHIVFISIYIQGNKNKWAQITHARRGGVFEFTYKLKLTSKLKTRHLEPTPKWSFIHPSIPHPPLSSRCCFSHLNYRSSLLTPQHVKYPDRHAKCHKVSVLHVM